MLPWCPRGTFSPGSAQPPGQKSGLWSLISTFCQNPLAGYWELGFAHTFGSPVRQKLKLHRPTSLFLPGAELQPPWGGFNSEQITSLIRTAWTHCSDKKDMEGNRGGKSAVEKAEVYLCKLRAQQL